MEALYKQQAHKYVLHSETFQKIIQQVLENRKQQQLPKPMHQVAIDCCGAGCIASSQYVEWIGEYNEIRVTSL